MISANGLVEGTEEGLRNHANAANVLYCIKTHSRDGVDKYSSIIWA